jgi:hypothetical protein
VVDYLAVLQVSDVVPAVFRSVSINIINGKLGFRGTFWICWLLVISRFLNCS